jgi:hypothetical protein
MPVPAELKLADCPLLRDTSAVKAADLVEQYNALGRQLAEVSAGKFAYLLNRPDLQGIVDDAKRVREQLTRPRYRVGFLGTSQAGKSTIFNKVLQEEIAQGGIGDATTSTITRFRRVDGAGNRFSIRFLTQDQYAERRDKLCKALHILNAGAKPNTEILAFLSDPAKLASLQEGDESSRQRRDRTGEKTLLPDDVPYLRDFLRSYDIHGARVVVKTGTPREVAVPFERRAEYLNHFDSETGTPSETLLVADAEVATPNPNIPQKLEAIDCPGLGSKRSVDTIITKEYLPHLDGALIFLRSDQLRSKDVVEILEVLKTNFGKLEGRVWIVVNKFDVLTREPLFGDANGNTVFDLIRHFVQDYQIPPEQVVFTSKRINELAAKNGGKASLEQVGVLLGLPAADPIPPRAKPDRAQAAAFQHLLDDGGIGHLRRLILETIADSVSIQISGAAKRELTSLTEELAHKVETEERRVKGGRQQLDDAIQCHDTVQELLLEISSNTDFFRPLAEHLQQKLYEKVVTGEQRKRVIESMSVDELAKQFQLHGKLLQQELDDQMNADVIDRLYGEVGERLYGLPNVPILRSAGPHDAWQEFRKSDRDPHAWRGRGFPNFRSEELFEGLTGSQVFSGFDGAAYLTLMREKIRVGVHHAMHAIRVQMRRRLKSMERELAMLIYKPEMVTK